MAAGAEASKKAAQAKAAPSPRAAQQGEVETQHNAQRTTATKRRCALRTAGEDRDDAREAQRKGEPRRR